jgi:ubiquinone/menaquinone biosynthesis C-methylase UbiE
MTSNKSANQLSSITLQEVQEHYMDYPYPYRNPEDEKQRLLQLMGESLGELNHHLYKGKKSFKKGFRVLIAGGGTGDSSTFLGEQLKDTDAEIVYLDFSKNSMEIAKKRAEIRGLKNITWINDSILNIPKLKLGKFDYINCSGVLHHLASPPEGLKILQESLKDDGGMCVMVYAKYGRTGVYQVQELMRMVNEGVTNRAEEVSNGNILVKALPATNWYVRGQELLADHLIFGDIGLYDMFLHKQDRAYSVPELYEFITDAGLNFIEFFDIKDRLALRVENYIKDAALLQKIQKMDKMQQQAICELICGTVIKHSVYLSKKKDVTATFDDLNNVPYFYAVDNIAQNAYDHFSKQLYAEGSAVQITVNNPWLKNANITIPVSKYTKYLFKNMIGESRSLKEIFDGVRLDSGDDVKDERLVDEVKRVFHPFLLAGILLLKDKSLL